MHHDGPCHCKTCDTNRLHSLARTRAMARLARMHREEFVILRHEEFDSLQHERDEWERRVAGA